MRLTIGSAASVAAALRSFSGQQTEYVFGKWFLQVRPLETHGPEFWSGGASYALTVLTEYPKDEQRRFKGKLSDAFDNLTKHCSTLPLNTTNAIAMKVPTPISMADAIDFTRSTFGPTHRHISAVHLYRTQLTRTADSSVLGHEYHEVGNPDAAVPAPKFRFEIPIGTLTEEPVTGLTVGDKRVELRQMYLFHQGHRFYRGTSSGNQVTFSMRRNFAEAVTAVGRAAGRTVRLDWPGPENWTVIL
jgi:hypothetical protein